MCRECRELKAKMYLANETQRDLANFLGISESNMNLKLNGKAEFTRGEMNQIIYRYDLSDSEIREYFFKENLT